MTKDGSDFTNKESGAGSLCHPISQPTSIKSVEYSLNSHSPSENNHLPLENFDVDSVTESSLSSSDPASDFEMSSSEPLENDHQAPDHDMSNNDSSSEQAEKSVAAVANSSHSTSQLSQEQDIESTQTHIAPSQLQDDEHETGWFTQLHEDSVEHIRAQKAAEFDSNNLDRWLNQGQTLLPDSQPTTKYLLESQNWGHISPRTDWEDEIDNEWLADKRAEINARGGRKAHFGKILPPHVIDERVVNHWSIMQDRDADGMTDTRRETERKLDVMFGLKGADDMIPAVINNHLVMIDPPEGNSGRRRLLRQFKVV